MLEKYDFLARAELLTQPPSAPEDFDVAIALDTAVQNRLGTTVAAIGHAKLWINIDHHPSNPRYGDLVYIDPTAPATGQILFEFLTNQKFPITPARARKSYFSSIPSSFQARTSLPSSFSDKLSASVLPSASPSGRT